MNPYQVKEPHPEKSNFVESLGLTPDFGTRIEAAFDRVVSGDHSNINIALCNFLQWN